MYEEMRRGSAFLSMLLYICTPLPNLDRLEMVVENDACLLAERLLMLSHVNASTSHPASILPPTDPTLSNHILILLQIKRPLILQPPPIIPHTRNLLPIVIRDRVRQTTRRRIGSVALNPRKKRLLLLHHQPIR